MKRFLQSYQYGALLILAFIFYSFNVQAQTEFITETSSVKIGVEDLLQIKFKVKNAVSVEQIHPPVFQHFRVVGAPAQESGMTSINGNTTRYIALTYQLKPERSGTFTIPAATAIVDGEKMESNTVKITVTRDRHFHPGNPGSGRSPAVPGLSFDRRHPSPAFDNYILRPGEDAAEKIRKNMFIALDVSDKDCYVGEPITASFKLYTCLYSESTITGAPSFNGFSVSDLDFNENGHVERHEGKKYTTYILRKVQLYPMHAGNITLEPLESSNTVTFIRQGSTAPHGIYDLLENFQMNTIPGNDIVQKTVSLKSRPVTIYVKPTPTKNIPADFKGAVGNFEITASLQKKDFTTDDASNLLITIIGSGNLQMVNAPEVQWPSQVDHYEPTMSDHINKQHVPMQGSKTFTIPFTVSRSGEYNIPPIQFCWFDPGKGKYQIASTAPLDFHVAPGKEIVPQIATNTLNQASKAGWLLSFSSLEWATGIILVAGLVLILFYFLFRKSSRSDELSSHVALDEIKSRSHKADNKFSIPGDPLAVVHEKLEAEDIPGFYRELNQSLKNYIALKLNVPVEEITRKRIAERLDECNVGIGTIRLTDSLMETIELNLFGRHAHPGQMRNDYENAQELISLLNKQVC